MEDDVDRQKLLGQSSSNHRSSHQPDLDHLTLQVQVNGPPILLALYILDRSFLIYFFFLTYKFVFLWQREAISCWVCAAMELVFIFDATGVNLSVKKAHRTLLNTGRGQTKNLNKSIGTIDVTPKGKIFHAREKDVKHDLLLCSSKKKSMCRRFRFPDDSILPDSWRIAILLSEHSPLLGMFYR